jgi:hypothetical protein
MGRDSPVRSAGMIADSLAVAVLRKLFRDARVCLERVPEVDGGEELSCKICGHIYCAGVTEICFLAPLIPESIRLDQLD